MLKYISNHEKVIVLLLKIVTEHLQDASAKKQHIAIYKQLSF